MSKEPDPTSRCPKKWTWRNMSVFYSMARNNGTIWMKLGTEILGVNSKTEFGSEFYRRISSKTLNEEMKPFQKWYGSIFGILFLLI